MTRKENLQAMLMNSEKRRSEAEKGKKETQTDRARDLNKESGGG